MWISLRDNKVVFEFVLGKVDEDIISLLSSLEIAGRSEATEEAIYSLSQRIKKDWWGKNKSRFIKHGSEDRVR